MYAHHPEKHGHTLATLCPAEIHPQSGTWDFPHNDSSKKTNGKTKATSVSGDFGNQISLYQVSAKPLNSSPREEEIQFVYIYTHTIYPWRKLCAHTRRTPETANPGLLHQAHEQRDFSPYMAISYTEQSHSYTEKWGSIIQMHIIRS